MGNIALLFLPSKCSFSFLKQQSSSIRDMDQTQTRLGVIRGVYRSMKRALTSKIVLELLLGNGSDLPVETRPNTVLLYYCIATSSMSKQQQTTQPRSTRRASCPVSVGNSRDYKVQYSSVFHKDIWACFSKWYPLTLHTLCTTAVSTLLGRLKVSSGLSAVVQDSVRPRSQA